MTLDSRVMVVTGTSKGIGRWIAETYLARGFRVVGCSRNPVDLEHPNYMHFTLDVSSERDVRDMFFSVHRSLGRVDVLINNAGIASMNHALLTPLSTVQRILDTNFTGTFLFCREAGRLMWNRPGSRIVNFATVATPLRLEGEAIYAASKAAVESLTRILAREFAPGGITVNAVGPTPVETDLIRSVPKAKMEALIARQAIRRYGTMEDIGNVIDFFIDPKSDFITGQILYLGGV